MRRVFSVFLLLTILMYIPPLLDFGNTNPMIPYLYWVSIAIIALVVSWIETSKWADKNV